MAAIRSGVTPVCIMRCFLRQSKKNKRGIGLFTDIVHPHLLQKSHLHTVFERNIPLTKTLLGRRQNGKFLWVSAVALRQNSTQITVEAISVAPPEVNIPAPQAVLTPHPENILVDPAPVLTQPITEQVADAAPTALDVLQTVAAEPSLAELGLANNTPVGLVQNLLEFMHVTVGLPWWGAIVTGTVLTRLLVFPVIVKGQREAAKLHNFRPELMKLRRKMNDAKLRGNKFEFAIAYSELTSFQKKHDVNPLRGFLIPMVQMPIFITFYFALRTMINLPVPSLQTGGVLWFPDLTLADPFYILPLAATATMYLIIELVAKLADNPTLKIVNDVRVLALAIFPLAMNFPSAVVMLLVTSNCFSVCQMALLNHPFVREKLRIPQKIKHPPSAL